MHQSIINACISIFTSEITQPLASTGQHDEAAENQVQPEKNVILKVECNEDAMMDSEWAESEEVEEEKFEVCPRN